jgi:dynein heavy chain, axonemal
MQPKLEQSSIETEKMMGHLKIEKAEADATQKIVSIEEIEATK